MAVGFVPVWSRAQNGPEALLRMAGRGHDPGGQLRGRRPDTRHPGVAAGLCPMQCGATAAYAHLGGRKAAAPAAALVSGNADAIQEAFNGMGSEPYVHAASHVPVRYAVAVPGHLYVVVQVHLGLSPFREDVGMRRQRPHGRQVPRFEQRAAGAVHLLERLIARLLHKCGHAPVKFLESQGSGGGAVGPARAARRSAPRSRLSLCCRLPNAKQPDSSLPEPGESPVADAEGAPDIAAVGWVEVTHPFHPWRGRRLLRQYCVTTGNVQLVRCIVDEDTLRCLPRAWTGLRIVDDFERASAGRVFFRLDDLAALRSLVDVLMDDQQ